MHSTGPIPSHRSVEGGAQEAVASKIVAGGGAGSAQAGAGRPAARRWSAGNSPEVGVGSAAWVLPTLARRHRGEKLDWGREMGGEGG
jgi:hypothetical protein